MSKPFKAWCCPERYHGFSPSTNYDWAERARIYLISSGPFLKIGIATDVERRLAQLRCGNPHPMKVESVRTVSRAMAHQVEARVHRTFAAVRLQGEWFHLSASEAKPVIHALIAKAHQAQERWKRDGYFEWRAAS